MKELRLRHLERLPLSASYPDLAKRLREVHDGLKQYEQAERSALVVDITGTGRSVVEYFRKASLSPIEAWISAGMGEKEMEPNAWRIAKVELVGQLQVLMHSDKFKVASGLDLVPVLKEELTNFRMRAPSTSGDDVESWRVGRADDLVFAAALATWRGQKDIPMHKHAAQEMARKIDEMNEDLCKWVV